jgi:hypothetical protein
METALQPRFSGKRFTPEEKEALLTQCRITLALAQSIPAGVTAVHLLEASKDAYTCFGLTWNQTQFERFLCILFDGGHVKLGRNMELVPT